jgi:hypothetical protein
VLFHFSSSAHSRHDHLQRTFKGVIDVPLLGFNPAIRLMRGYYLMRPPAAWVLVGGCIAERPAVGVWKGRHQRRRSLGINGSYMGGRGWTMEKGGHLATGVTAEEWRISSTLWTLGYSWCKSLRVSRITDRRASQRERSFSASSKVLDGGYG